MISGIEVMQQLSATSRFVKVLQHLQEMWLLLTAQEKSPWMLCSAGGWRNTCGSVLTRGGVERSVTVTVMPVPFAWAQGNTFACSRGATVNF